MNILEAILNAQNGAAAQQAGSQVGLSPDQTNAALAALVPALAAGFQRNVQSEGGLDTLLSTLASGRHTQYVDNPAVLGDPTTVDDGNGILGHLLGSKEVSREVANQPAFRRVLAELFRMVEIVLHNPCPPSADFAVKNSHINVTCGSFSLAFADLSLRLKPKLQVAA